MQPRSPHIFPNFARDPDSHRDDPIRALAQLDLIASQKELAKREVYIKYDYEDLLSE